MLSLLKKALLFTGLGMMSWVLTGCGVYSFSGTALSSEVKTVSIETFPNNANLVVPTLSQTFTEKLRQKFLEDTNLELVEQGGDLVFSGEITRYEVSPEVIQGGQQASLSKLTIAIRTKYDNNVNADNNFDRSFSHYETFRQSQSLDQVEDRLIREITDKIIQDIFNQSVNNW